MFGKKALPVGTLVVMLIIALAGLGLGYALWSTTLTDAGTVTTGTFGAKWAYTFTDDGGTVDDSTRDVGDIKCKDDSGCVYPKGPCPAGGGCESARDPSGPGPNGPRYDKAIGHCASSILDTEQYKILHWDVSNAYPSYYCTVWSFIGSTGSVPMKVQARTLNHSSQIETGFVAGLNCGDQIDPEDQLPVGMWVHVLQTATPGATYSGNSSYTLVQWNEWSSGACTGW